MMFNLYHSAEQENRERQELEQIYFQANRETDLYDEGRFDGITGCEPTQLEEQSYWTGYQLGQREYWAKKLNVKLATEF